MNKFFSSFKWILFFTRRVSRVDRKGRTAVTSFLASLGVCFGVMALIVSIGVINGFQLSFINSIMEISSGHVRVSGVQNASEFEDFCALNRKITSAIPFYEGQGLMVGYNGAQSPALIRAVPQDMTYIDEGFNRELVVYQGAFDLSQPDSIVLGNRLASALGARVGSQVNILAMSGSSDVDLLSQGRVFTVRGIFYCGYDDINHTYAFISDQKAEEYFGQGTLPVYCLKLTDSNLDSEIISVIKKNFPHAGVESWRSYNRTFFGALRMEKNMLFLLVFLIFIVVAINIYNSMRRMVYERKDEIAMLSTFGASRWEIQNVFILRGFLTGVLGAVPGLLLGLFICANMREVFLFIAQALYWCEYFAAMLFNPSSARYVAVNTMFRTYSNFPPKVFAGETMLITFFGIFSSLAASWLASRKILDFTVSEVLRDE